MRPRNVPVTGFASEWVEDIFRTHGHMAPAEMAKAAQALWHNGTNVMEVELDVEIGLLAGALVATPGTSESHHALLDLRRTGPGTVLYSECGCEDGGEETADCIHVRALALVALAWGLKAGFLKPGSVRLPTLPPRQLEALSRALPSPDTPAPAEPAVQPHTPGNAPAALPTTPVEKDHAPEERPWFERVFSPDRPERKRAWRQGITAAVPRQLAEWHADRVAFELSGVLDPLAALGSFPSVLMDAMHVAGRADPKLVAFVGSARAAEMANAWRTAWTQQRLNGWLGQDAEAAPQPLNIRVEWTIPPVRRMDRIPFLEATVFADTRSQRNKVRKGQALEALLREHNSGRRTLTRRDLHIVDFLLFSGGYEDSPGDETVVVVRPSLWAGALQGPELVWSGSEPTPVQVDTEPAELALVRQGDRAVWLVHHRGQQLPLKGARVAQTPMALDIEPQLWVRVGNALALLETHGLPLDLLAHSVMSDGFLRSTLAPHTLRSPVFVRIQQREPPPGFQRLAEPVRVRAHATLRWDDNVLTAQVTAQGDRATFVLEAPGVWSRAPSPPPANPQAAADVPARSPAEDALLLDPGQTAPLALPDPDALLLDLPAPEDVEPLNLWLAHAPGTAEQAPGGLRFVVPRKKVPLLRDWWRARPAGVAFRGNVAFQRLVSLAAAPRVAVKVTHSGMDWLEVSAELQGDVDALPLEEVLAALADQSDALVQLKAGAFERRDLEAYARRLTQLMDLGIEAGGKPQRLHALQLAMAPPPQEEDATDGMADLRDAVAAVVKTFSGVPETPLPAESVRVLRPYQKTGVDFLVWAARTLGGALLADDMGLGKTLQVLVALRALRKRGEPPVLVVAPASVVRNWAREAQKFTPDLVVKTLERGTDRQAQLEAGADLYVTNPALLRRDMEHLKAKPWSAVVLDEAQVIKNRASETARAIKTIPAQHRFAMTGTPVENRVDDLVSIMEFVAPGYLGNVPGTPGPSALRVLRARLRPLMLRRTKKEAAPDLPERVEERLDCDMTPAQRKMYAAELKKTREILGGMRGSIKGADRIIILTALMRLRQLATDPALLGNPRAGSGKMDELMDTLTTLTQEGHKVLVFSQFVRVLDGVSERLTALGIPQRMLTGATPPAERQTLVDAFEKDTRAQVFLISLKAGGAGLNLQSAAHVVIVDPWWNPAVEAQAIDRAHRIGQTRTVLAVRLISRGTVEERILELQDKKRALAAGILDEDAYTGMLTREDLEFLVSAPDGAGQEDETD